MREICGQSSPLLVPGTMVLIFTVISQYQIRDNTTRLNHYTLVDSRFEIVTMKEMKNVMPAFQFSDDNKIPIGYTKIPLHMVFDVKMVGLVRKATSRLVAGGHVTEEPKKSTYSSVVSRDSVRIAFLIAALNDLDVLAADAQTLILMLILRRRFIP